MEIVNRARVISQHYVKGIPIPTASHLIPDPELNARYQRIFHGKHECWLLAL